MAKSQYIIFKLDQGDFGINIMNIREIITYKESTPLPKTPDYIRGIINHRGSVVPIIDLKERFRLGKFQETEHSRIIIITINKSDIGFLVDEASQTIILEEDEIDSKPSHIDGIYKKYIVGVGKLEDERLLILIDLKKVLSHRDFEELENLGRESQG